MERHRIKLNTENSQRAVNVDLFHNIHLESESKPLPYNDIKRVINENEQFNKERNSSNIYRITSTVNGLFTNVLFNITKEGSWETFNQSIFRDRTFPPDGVSVNQDEDYSYEESVSAHLKERDGWFGYLNPKINEFSDNEFYFMEPTKEKFELVHRNLPNWGVTITYPDSKLINELTENGLTVTSLKQVMVGGREMTAIGSPYNHNLALRDNVKIIVPSQSKEYQVMRLGLDNGDFKENYFVIDTLIGNLDQDKMTFKKVYSGVDCEYYFRVFKRVKTVDGTAFSNKDYDLYPLAFSKNVFNDSVYQFATKDDIDLTGLTDNLGRPVTEVFVSFIKNNNKGFTNIKSGLNLKNIYDTEDFTQIPDIRKIHNGTTTPFETHTSLNESVLFDDEEYIGDLVEYNKMLLRETVLNEVNHRFNTLNREEGGGFDTALPPAPQTSSGRTVRSNTTTTREGSTRTSTTYSSTTASYDESQIYMTGSDEGAIRGRETIEYIGIDDGGGSGGFLYTEVNLSLHPEKSNVCGVSKSLFYANTSVFGSINTIFMDPSGLNRAIPGFYSDGSNVRYWDGNVLGPMEVCPSVTSTCLSIKGVYGAGSNGIFLGGFCYSTQDDTERVEFFLSGKTHYDEVSGGGNNTSCAGYFNQKVGTIVSSIPFNGELIYPTIQEKIYLVSSNYQYNNKSYMVYAIWNDVDNRAWYVRDVYLVCNETPESGGGNENVNLGSRQEGYYYKPFHRVQLRNFSDYIEDGDENTDGIPDYAEKLEDDRYIWRDLMNVGNVSKNLDYPFVNGCHYIHTNQMLAIKRQDPFGDIGLYFNGDIPDIGGIKLTDKNKTKQSGDIC